jgi:AraC-like DNA-binding protein
VIARKLGTSKSSLHVVLSREGVTYRDVLKGTREELARRYLEAGRYTIKEVAYLLGFSDATTFSRAFKRWTDTPPLRYTAASRGTRERLEPPRGA